MPIPPDTTRSAYAQLDRYAEDVATICRDLALSNVTFVGHSVSAMIGVLAHIADPDLITALVLIGPSARYIDDGDYFGGFQSDRH